MKGNLIASIAFGLLANASEVKVDPATGMTVAEGWEVTRAHCTGCHSAQQFTRQRGTRRNWEEMIRWMQKTQGLWVIDVTTETQILDYLAKHYGPQDGWRRAPIPAGLLPPNPYPSEIAKSAEKRP